MEKFNIKEKKLNIQEKNVECSSFVSVHLVRSNSSNCLENHGSQNPHVLLILHWD